MINQRQLDRTKVSRSLLIVLAAYAVLRIPLVASSFPAWYHQFNETIIFQMARDLADTGNAYGGSHITNAGLVFNGLIAAPVFLLDLPEQFVRSFGFIAGLVTITFVWKIQVLQGISERSRFATAFLLVVIPHFVIMTGFATYHSLHMMFGVLAIYYFLKWRESRDNWRFAIFSGLFAGFAALNHLAGFAVTGTVLALLLVGDLGRLKELLRSTGARKLLISYMFWMTPALIYFIIQKSTGALDNYDKFTFRESNYLLTTTQWWRWQIHYMAEYQPHFAVIMLAIVTYITVWIYRKRSAKSSDYRPSHMSKATQFWLIWFLIGLFQVFYTPQGALIHEYYMWWSLIPSVPLLVGLLDFLIGKKRNYWMSIVGAVILLSAIVSVAQVSRAYGATDIPILCRYQNCESESQ